jgi:hypothetical protein
VFCEYSHNKIAILQGKKKKKNKSELSTRPELLSK